VPFRVIFAIADTLAITVVVYVKFLRNVACQKLLKSARVSKSYSEIKSGLVFWDTVSII